MKASTLNFIWSIGYYASAVLMWAWFFYDLKTDEWYQSAIEILLALAAVLVAGKKSDLALRYAEEENHSFLT